MLPELAERLTAPTRPVDLVFTTREEIGCQGAQYYARRTDAVAMVALEVVPVAEEYAIAAGPEPVLIRADAHGGPLDDGLSFELADAAAAEGVAGGPPAGERDRAGAAAGAGRGGGPPRPGPSAGAPNHHRCRS